MEIFNKNVRSGLLAIIVTSSSLDACAPSESGCASMRFAFELIEDVSSEESVFSATTIRLYPPGFYNSCLFGIFLTSFFCNHLSMNSCKICTQYLSGNTFASNSNYRLSSNFLTRTILDIHLPCPCLLCKIIVIRIFVRYL